VKIPEFPKQTNSFLWGAAVGAVTLAIAGFNWFGWVSGGTAEKLAAARAEVATVTALTPICVAQFQTSPKAQASLAALKDTQGYEQAEYVSKGGWATMPGTPAADPIRAVAQACAEALTKAAP
jgi:hypothetical protein